MTGCYEARIAAVTPTGVMVTIAGLTGTRERQGPLPYAPIVRDNDGTLELVVPARGDRCWVLLDEDGQPACVPVIDTTS
jgi:hypothetical protein